MLQCLWPSSTTPDPNIHSSSPPFQATSAEGTPSSSSQVSPVINLTHEYRNIVHTISYRETWSKFYPDDSSYEEVESEQLEGNEEHLHPSRECVQGTFQLAKASTLTDLVSAYFNQSEDVFRHCLLLKHRVKRARLLYAPLKELFANLPHLDSISDPLSLLQCQQVFDVFLHFDRDENPFSDSDFQNFHLMHSCFSQLKEQLNYRLHKSRSRVRLYRHATSGSSICLIGTAVAVTVSAVAITSHVLAAFVAVPFLSAFAPSKITKKELANVAQLDETTLGIFVLDKHLDTTERLVTHLNVEVEGNKDSIRLALNNDWGKHLMECVTKQLYRKHFEVLDQLIAVEEHLCLCFKEINHARSLLLEVMYLQQTHLS